MLQKIRIWEIALMYAEKVIGGIKVIKRTVINNLRKK